MVYIAPKRIYVSQDRRRIVDPAEHPEEPAFLLVGAGQQLDDATAEALGLSGSHEGDANEDVVSARTLHMPSTAFGYTETGSMSSGGGARTPLGPGGIPVQATGRTTTAPGGADPGNVERVMSESGVAESTAANLAAADAQARMGYEAQAASDASLRAESARQPHGSNIVGEKGGEPDTESAEAYEKEAKLHSDAARKIAERGQDAAEQAIEAGDTRRTGGVAAPESAKSEKSSKADEEDEKKSSRKAEEKDEKKK